MNEAFGKHFIGIFSVLDFGEEHKNLGVCLKEEFIKMEKGERDYFGDRSKFLFYFVWNKTLLEDFILKGLEWTWGNKFHRIGTELAT